MSQRAPIIPSVREIAFDTVLDPTLVGLDIWDAGEVSVQTVAGEDVTRDIPAAALPFRWVLAIRQVYDVSGVALADIDALVDTGGT